MVGAGQEFDGNGPWLRVQPGGGPVLVRDANPTGEPGDQFTFGNTIEAPQGIQPALPDKTPAYRPDVACFTNPLPDLNGPGAAVGPSDLTTP